MLSPFLERLARGPLLADGAMGTQLYARGVSFSQCFDQLNVTRPELVQQVHREYIAAGAELIETNTFGANRVRLDRHGLADQVREFNFRGARLAREAREIAGEPVFVGGSIGPLGRQIKVPTGVTIAEVREVFREQILALVEGGVDVLIFETFYDLEELREAILAARASCDLPILAQVTVDEDLRTLTGHDLEAVAAELDRLDVDVVGVNCSVGPQGTLEAIERLAAATRHRLSAMPNAGLPVRLEGRFMYTTTAEYFADYARRFLKAGVAIVGGCCGTTPDHTRAMREAIAELTLATTRPAVTVVTPVPPAATASPLPPTEPTALAKKLAAGKFVVSVELDPPKGLNPAKVLAGAKMLKEVGIDCVNIGDSPMARIRMSCLALAYLIEERVGLESIIHFTTRDRNLMALQSDLLGAHAIGVRNVLALTGDPPRLGDYPNASGVWDVDSVGLIAILKRMNQGTDWAGTSIGQPTSFHVACAVNPNADDLDKELERFRRKLDAGADFVMAQPLYDRETLERFFDRTGPIPVPFLFGIMPLQSHRHAEFLHNEVPGITIPEPLRERMRVAGDHGIQEGIALAYDLLVSVKELVQGIYLMPSFGRYEMVAEIVKALK